MPGRTPPTVIAFPENRGKGAAVRAGVAASTGETVLYMDADLATDIAGLDEFLKLLEDYDVVVGLPCRAGSDGAQHHPAAHGDGAHVQPHGADAHPARGARLAVRLQGVLAATPGRLVFSLSTVDGFAFDPEVLMIARALGLSVTEVPVDWTAVEGSSVRPLRDSFVTGLALVRVVWQVPAAARARPCAGARVEPRPRPQGSS